MKYIVKCQFCESTNLKKMNYVQGAGESFICLDCENEMSLRDIEFKEDKIKKGKE